MKLVVKTIAVAAISLAAVSGISACGVKSSSEAPPANSASPEGTFKIGDTEVSSGLPSGWPSDVPTPQGLTVKGGGAIAEGMSASWSGQGNIQGIQAQLDADFKANGFKAEGGFGNGANGGVTAWKKGATVVNVIVASQDGEVVVNETIVTKQS